MRKVKEDVYSQEYFETDCGGHEVWRESCGRELPPRLAKAWEVAKIRNGMKVLDWGSGRGEMSYHAAAAGAEVLGLDYAEAAITLAKKLPKDTKGKMKFEKIDDLKIPAADNTFDRILFVDVIEHLYSEQLAILMKEFARVLKPKGRLIIHTFPNLDHYNIGYSLFTRFAHMLVNPLWQMVFHEKLRDDPSPRFGYDAKVHVNECSLRDVKMFCEDAGLSANVWYDSKWRMIRRRDKIRYTLFQPLWLSNRYFADDIWCVATKLA